MILKMMNALNKWDREVLANLTFGPVGAASVAELADGLLDNRGPEARGRVRAALERIGDALGGLCVARGNDAFGRCDVELYSIDRQHMLGVRAFCRRFDPYRQCFDHYP